MHREAPYSIDGHGLVPSDFYASAEYVLPLFPDEWEQVFVRPEFVRDAEGRPVSYSGCGWFFERNGKYVAFMTEHPRDLARETERTAMQHRVRYAFSKAGVS
jgi:hypothetical protein